MLSNNEIEIVNTSDMISDSEFFIDSNIPFEKEKHINFLKFTFRNLKKQESLESHKITILYFIVGSLKLLNALTEEEKELSIEFVINNAVICNNKIKGFRGGNFSGWSYNKSYTEWNYEDKPHIAATYCALSILKICSYLLSTDEGLQTVNKKFRYVLSNEKIIFNEEEIIKEIQQSQISNGKICAQSWHTENDVRFFYCAMAIFKIFGKTSEEIRNLINYEKSLSFLSSIRNYEGGFSMIDEGESNAGTTFVTIASYLILDLEIPNTTQLINWLCSRNSILGINGRTNKIPDSCYSFWVMGSLSNLGYLDLFNREHTINFLLNCQTDIGGFSKHLNFDKLELPDLLHSYYSLSALALIKYEGLFNETKNERINFDSLLAIPY